MGQLFIQPEEIIEDIIEGLIFKNKRKMDHRYPKW